MKKILTYLITMHRCPKLPISPTCCGFEATACYKCRADTCEIKQKKLHIAGNFKTFPVNCFIQILLASSQE